MTLRGREFHVLCITSLLNGSVRRRRKNMTNTNDKLDQNPPSPKEQLRNLIEALCEEPYALESAEYTESWRDLSGVKDDLIDAAHEQLDKMGLDSQIVENEELFDEKFMERRRQRKL